MMHSNRMFPYLIGAAALAAVLVAFGAPLATVLPFAIFLACPLMMFVMMRGMSGTHGHEDHTGHGCERDSTRTTEPTTSHSQRPAPRWGAPAAKPPTARWSAIAEPGTTTTAIDPS